MKKTQDDPTLVTGCAGFIGYHTSHKLLTQGKHVYGIDNLNAYYDVSLKRARLNALNKFENFQFKQIDISHRPAMKDLFSTRFQKVIHLAAQAGVRYSLENPSIYIDSNLVGFGNILEGCRHAGTEHLVYASSSSVYGLNTQMPFSTDQNVDRPISLYAATKKSNELMAHAYSHLFSLPTTGLRFFTVYGPWGRPDMSLFLFTRSILNNEPISVFNNGQMKRDFTYIDDIVEGVLKISEIAPPQKNSKEAPYRVLNIGNNAPVGLMDFITTLEDALGKKAIKNYLPLQPGDVPETYADVSDLEALIDFKPQTSIQTGIGEFVRWYQTYYLR